MNQLQSPSASRDETVNLTAESVFHGVVPVDEVTHDSADSFHTWFLAVTGCVVAALTAVLSCQLPNSHPLSGATIFFLAVKYIALTTTVGTIGISIPWFLLRAKRPLGLTFLAKQVGVGWIFFPCITLLYRQQSLWMFPALALVTVALAFSLRRVFPATVKTNQEELPAWHTRGLPSLYGLPPTDSRPMRAFFIAICAQSALLFAISGHLFLASLLLSTSLFLLVWRWSAAGAGAIRKFSGRRQSIELCALSIILTALALIPWVGGRLHSGFGGNEAFHRAPSVTHQPAEADRPNSDYIGVILWPPPIKKEVLPPIPHSNSFAIGRAFKPLVIPFDGQYWYFKSPSKRPGPRAHIAHGKSTEVNVRSSDFAPLLMEAYQNLGSSIDLSCCSEIDVAITNADIRPGKIALGILLTDSNSLGKPSRNLGSRSILSSEPMTIPFNRKPIHEVLRFPIPRSSAAHRFNEITVVYLPAPERARGGAKVSIQSFTLTPR